MEGHVLYISWGSLSDNDMTEVFKKNGFKVTGISFEPRDYDHDRDLEEKAMSVLRGSEKPDFVFSFNYLPVVSRLCKRAKTFYISWVYDSPHLTLYSETIKNEYNYIFHFDMSETQRLKENGCPNAFHLPLGVNGNKYEKNENVYGKNSGRYEKDADFQDKNTDISFLGSLYTENFYDSISYLPPELSGYFDGLISAQKLVYGQDVITPCLDEKRLSEIKKYVSFSLGEGYNEDSARLFADMFLLRKVTSLERIEIMERLFKEFKNVRLYTGSDVSGFSGIKSSGYADYEKEMPGVFKGSRINLNISLRTIRSGIPLRVMDIMGAGGFVLTNYQPELFKYFVPGEDFDYYMDTQDLIEKCKYYLEHEEIRRQIAENGMKKVRREHGMEKKLKFMMERLRMEEKHGDFSVNP